MRQRESCARETKERPKTLALITPAVLFHYVTLPELNIILNTSVRCRFYQGGHFEENSNISTRGL